MTQEIFKKKLLYRDIEEIKHFDFNLSKIQKIKKISFKNIFTCRINKDMEHCHSLVLQDLHL